MVQPRRHELLAAAVREGDTPAAAVSIHMNFKGSHQEITLVYICRIRMRLYVIKSLNDMYMSNNF